MDNSDAAPAGPNNQDTVSVAQDQTITSSTDTATSDANSENAIDDLADTDDQTTTDDTTDNAGTNISVTTNLETPAAAASSEPASISTTPTTVSPSSPAPASITFDVFHWANEVDEIKNNVSVELFLFNKNYTPYKVRYSDQLTASVKAFFMQEATGYIIKEADKGLECRDYEKSDGEDKVIYRTKLTNVGRAETLIHLIEHEYRNIDDFNDHADDFKKIKGIIARFTYPGGDAGTKCFYIAKAISPSSALKGGSSWELNGEGFEPFSADVALKVPDDNQVAVIDDTVIIFNQSKFATLFQYDYKSQVIADEKAKELTDKYKLSFAEGLALNSLLQDRKPLVKKLQSLDIPAEMPQSELIDYADKMQLDLMTDDDGSIIIMDDKDLTMFVNLLSEDYYISPVNGKRYEIKSKKLLSEPEGEPPRG